MMVKNTLAHVVVGNVFKLVTDKSQTDYKRTGEQIGQMIFVVNQLTGELVKMGGNRVVK